MVRRSRTFSLSTLRTDTKEFPEASGSVARRRQPSHDGGAMTDRTPIPVDGDHRDHSHLDTTNWIDEPPKNGMTRTHCGICGRFLGYRPTSKHRQKAAAQTPSRREDRYDKSSGDER
jgi:hypothetical protein